MTTTPKPRKTDLAPDQKFGKWTVIKLSEHRFSKHAYYLCRCECGHEREVLAYKLRNGLSTSCGCESAKKKGWKSHFNLTDVNLKAFKDDLRVMKLGAIQKKYGISKCSISKYRKQFNARPVNPDRSEYDERLRDFYEANMTVRRMSQILNQSTSFIYDRLAILGLDRGNDMEFKDRSTRKDFLRYWSKRQWHFNQIYGVPFTQANAKNIYETEVKIISREAA